MYAAVSYRYKTVIQSLKSIGLEPLEVPPYNDLTDNYESSHADMQVLRIEDTLFLLKNNDKFNEKIRSKTELNVKYTVEFIEQFSYPQCVKLNAAVVDGRIIANMRYIDPIIADSFPGYKQIHVSQGYAKCSSAVVSDRAVITSDESIYQACLSEKIDCLKICEGYISLCERYGGFIGGSCFQLEDTLFFTGRIEDHPDRDRIRSFCSAHGVRIKSLTNSPLTDVGGVIIF